MQSHETLLHEAATGLLRRRSLEQQRIYDSPPEQAGHRMTFGSIMCFGSSNKDDPEAKKSKEIEKQLREDQKRLAREVKLLLLGKQHHGQRGK